VPYQGVLDNGGETVELRLPPRYDNLVVFSFAYEPAWAPHGRAFQPTATDLKPSWLSREESWLPTALGGRPAGLSPTSSSAYYRWLISHDVAEPVDADRDDFANIFEYATDLLPTAPSAASWSEKNLTPTTLYLTPTDPAYGVQFALPRDPTVPGGHGRAEVRYQLQGSDDLIQWQTLASKMPSNSTWVGPVTVGSLEENPVRITLAPSFLSTEKPYRYWRLSTDWIR
jgi:hypothetical protein